MRYERAGFAAVVLLATPAWLIAQAPAENGTWRRVNEPSPARTVSQAANIPAAPGSSSGPLDEFGMPARQGGQNPSTLAAPPVLPSQLTIRPGTFLTVRVDQPLSSDRNQPGDAFSGTLARPLVVDGVVIADRGQTVGGRVVETQKAGKVTGVSRLAIELTDLTLADGQQLPIKTQLAQRSGPTSQGQDASAIAGATGMGAAIGAAADWGRGAAIGAGVGAAASIIGVLLTRGHETVIYPETMLAFRIENQLTVSTERAPQAFRFVDRDDYDRPAELQRRPPPERPACGPYGCPPPYYPAFPYPYYYGPGAGFYYGVGFNIGRGYYHGYRH